MTITLNNALASLSAQLRQQPGAATFTVSREELDAVVGGVLNDARRRKEKQEKDEQNLKFMARTPHCLRHTFATWHYCLYRDLLRLKDDGGWRTITMVARYAKKMPDAYRDEIKEWLGL